MLTPDLLTAEQTHRLTIILDTSYTLTGPGPNASSQASTHTATLHHPQTETTPQQTWATCTCGWHTPSATSSTQPGSHLNTIANMLTHTQYDTLAGLDQALKTVTSLDQDLEAISAAANAGQAPTLQPLLLHVTTQANKARAALLDAVTLTVIASAANQSQP